MSLRAAILGFLRLQPTSGYTLKQRFEGSVGSFWSVTQSQIYRELHALERDGRVASHAEAGDGKPGRKVYGLTESGRGELDAWLRAPLEPIQLRHPLLLKLVFAADVEPKALDSVLEGYQAGLEATHVEYQRRLRAREIFSLARSPREADIWRLSIEHGLSWCATELGWVKKARRKLSTQSAKPKRAKARRP